ncbi:hypothetical protein V6N13_133621 [Hibiscus sabdariffa]
MDSVTASKERLKFAKVCIEIGMDTKIPDQVRIVLRDKSTINVKVVVPWLTPSYQNYKTFGHSTKVCSMVKPKGVQVWRKKEVTGVVLVNECGETSVAGELREEVSNLGGMLQKEVQEHSGASLLVVEPKIVSSIREVGDTIDNVVVYADVGDNVVVSTDVGDSVVVSVGIGDNVVVSADVRLSICRL